MEVNVNKLRQSVNWLREHVGDNSLSPADKRVLQKFSQLDHVNEVDIQDLFQWLSEHLLDENFTEQIAVNFEEFLLLILSKSITKNEGAGNFSMYQQKCFALAKLQRLSVEARRYATNYFRTQPAPFEDETEIAEVPPKKKSKKLRNNKLALLTCCYQLLSVNPAYYKELWNWSILVKRFLQTKQDLSQMEQLYFNHILALLSNMSSVKLTQLNAQLTPAVLLEFDEAQNQRPAAMDLRLDDKDTQIITYNFQSESITNVEGVLLPVFDKENYKFYAKTDGVYEQIVKVDSTKVNLRSIALGVAASKTICLSGPVGCGKTTLVHYLARKTGRICPKANEIAAQDRMNKENNHGRQQKNGIEKLKDNINSLEANLNDLLNLETRDANGFLRIQLGDQTDSKMLLGQYRCTDVPGEFIWLPGILTQAVMNGYWLLLEDLDCATQDTYTILSGLLENNYLSVPGYRDCVKIQPGFQLFVTVRTNKSSTNSSQKSLYTLLEKYLYTINILPLSRNELCKVVSTNYPKLATVANRIVDVFLTFSSGDHSVADNLREQETGDKADNTEKYVALPFEPVSLAAIPNGGRLVSTRDLVKLCQRSNPMFSVTSTECAYFVFQNAVDVFCSNLPQGKEKTKLIVSIGAKLGIIRSRCETFADDYKPEVNVYTEHIKVGRAKLYAKGHEAIKTEKNLDGNESDEDFLKPKQAKRQKLALTSTTDQPKIVASRSTFSFTRLAVCLLERIAVCVSHAEPVLLVGETGVGKTSSVQYLAERTAHKLIVVNMNNQSDVSDLVGGFKPVDLSYVLLPLRQEFETLFCETYDAAKNFAFLSKLGSCYNQNVFNVLVKMMIKVTDAALTAKPETPVEILKLQPRWQLLKSKLLKLDSQLAKSLNISFAFIPGSLVNCIKNGDWVLLDEINLASAETLECLSTILEPDGSVVLLEKGDFTPVQRHADFRIFACMNPNTDVGKKDLPVGIRNRFTEFFVDELTTDSDLSLLVSDYLNSTGILSTKVTSIVQLYKELRKLASLKLNDGLGNRPVYSLRTLCRALRICAKNLCGSIERNLYESFCLSFLTQLDPESHKRVLSEIKKRLVSNEKQVLGQLIPKPSTGNHLNFEGYWIQPGPKEVQPCENYILTDSVRANLKDLARIISIGKLPILLQGPTSAGKTSLIEYVAKRSGNHCLRINNHEHTDLQEYIGTYVADVSGKLKFHEGVLVQAMRNGFWIILDELNLASTEILEALNRVLDDNRELFIPETQSVVKAHKNFMLFATQNPPGLYGGRKTLSRAFKNRFIELHFSEIPRAELEIILERRCFIPPSYAKKMVMCMADLQKNRKTTSKNVFTLRDLFRWGNRYTYADKKLLEDKNYDWNQHLVEEGYLVLSAKVRTDLELEIIEQALYQNFKKRIDLERLFDAAIPKESQSPVTAGILQAIGDFKARLDIVWTRNMTRMAVLTAKALEFDEPVLLVGPTGCGKTTVCQLLASIKAKQLRILNCHMHTEGADFLGGLRPCRQTQDNENSQRQLFEWSDGPLIQAMQEGSYFMADEISLAEDSVLERLNCILEPERTVLLAEKGGVAVDESGTDAARLQALANDFVVQAKHGFQFLATMNPGGDFGKKELSPALRNRFTEIWCLPSDSKADLIQIASNCMQNELNAQNTQQIATYLVEIVLYIKAQVEKFKFSVRDILAWANYIKQNDNLGFPERAIFGLETIFLDALEMLPHESLRQIEQIRMEIIAFAIKQADILLNEKFTIDELEAARGKEVIATQQEFGLKPFLLKLNESKITQLPKDFTFKAPTTKKNLFRLLSALSLQKPILLEGPPGVGKTSTVESLAKAIGYKIVRINLCEHTDLADLFGTDLPAEDNVLTTTTQSINSPQLGSFSWRDGPLLAALKAEATWILLDELNLAPQSVLEGLNAILDHRGEVYIPELNKSFSLNKTTRIFACQNPLKQGGGRKGLPQSFLNRFNKVYLRKLTTADLLYVVNEKYNEQFEILKEQLIQPIKTKQYSKCNIFELNNNTMEEINPTQLSHFNFEFDLSTRLVKFSEELDFGVANLEFGYKGGPYEFNLRDILRWCDFLVDKETGVNIQTKNSTKNTPFDIFKVNFQDFLQTLYDTMKLVYMQRMRTSQDQMYIQTVFGRIFQCNAVKLNEISEDVSLYWTDEHLFLNDLIIARDIKNDTEQNQLRPFANKMCSPLLLSTQRQNLQNIVACVKHQKPVLLCGATDTGKSKLIDVLCTISNQVCNTDNIDDSVTGSFQQIDLNRHLEELSGKAESIFWSYIQTQILEDSENTLLTCLLDSWYDYILIEKSQKEDLKNSSTTSRELLVFRQRVEHLSQLIQKLMNAYSLAAISREQLNEVKILLEILQRHTDKAETLNMGGSFEWVDSKIVKSIKYGQNIALEHVNLCSSAVLDRLNPVFEPNGNLLISEKGVTATDTAEVVEKSPNFRAFLTIDPKNGELSRAMRNRCVELSLQKDAYNADDLRQLIHANGVRDIKAVNCILQMHNSIRTFTEINSYNVSHLNQCAFLVASYKRIGYATSRAIYVSGMEVYVYSANMDLLGYGLSYYQNKLRDIVLEQMKMYVQQIKDETEIEHEDYLALLALNCADLNQIKFVKLLTAPLKLMLKSETTNTQLGLYFEEYKNLCNTFTGDCSTILRFYIYMIYETSTFADLETRNLYLKEILKSNSTMLMELSMQLFECVSNFKNNFTQDSKETLPWNKKLYPRLQRAYDNDSNDHLYRLSTALISRLLMPSIPEAEMIRQQDISAFNYSRALFQKLVTEKSENVFLKLLAEIFSCLKQLIEPKLMDSSVNVTEFVAFVTKILWFNRFLGLAQSQLFIKKVVDKNLLDKLMLHYEWLCKHLLSFLAKITNEADYQSFDKIFHSLNDYIATVKPKLNLIRKFYVKRMMAFPPYYKEEQIRLQSIAEKLDNLLSVVPSYGSFTKEQIQRKFKAQKSTAAGKAHAMLNQHKETIIIKSNIQSIEQLPAHLRDALERYTSELKVEKLTKTLENTEFEELENQIESIRCEVDSQEELVELEQPKDIELGLLSLRDFYLTKALLHKVESISFGEDAEEINIAFCEDIHTLSRETWQLLHLYGKDGDNKSLLSFLKHLMAYIDSLKTDDSCAFNLLVENLAGSYKEFNAIWRTLVFNCYKQEMKSMATHINCTQQQLTEMNSDISYEGPFLVNVCLSLLFKADGSLKPVPLKDLDTWQRVLNQMRQLIWQNARVATPQYNQVTKSFSLACKHAKKLYLEVHGNDVSVADEDYRKLLNTLQLQLSAADELKLQHFKHQALKYQAMQYHSSLLNALIGAVELSTLVAMPLIDPVEKQRLKKLYLAEDIKCLTDFRYVYDLMRIVLKYKHFGDEIYEEICKQLHSLELKQLKQTQSVALRPEQCLYAKLVQDIQHFLITNCEPAALLKLLALVQSVWSNLGDNKFDVEALETCREVSSKLSLWLANGQRFVYHVLKPYAGYYEDFLKPLQCAVLQFSFGLSELKCVLSQLEHAISLEERCNYNQNAHIQRLIGNFAEFPNTRVLKVGTKTYLSALNSGHERLRMLQLKIDALNKHLHISKEFSDTAFEFLDLSLAEYNEIWQSEEEHLKQLKAADDSLYVHKTKCETEDEELLELQEIETYFPTQIEEDYGDYLQTDTLEQTKEKKLTKTAKKPLGLFNETHTSILVENFIELLEFYAPVCYYKTNNKAEAAENLDFKSTASSRLQTFVTLYNRHKLCLNTWLDEQAYNAICIAITMQENLLKQTPERSITSKNPKTNIKQQQIYNFYKDSNIPEIIACTELLERIRALTQIQLDLYPEHATLIDIQQIIARIIQLPSNAPLVRFSTGFQLLRQKLAQWNEVAHKNNHLRNEEIELAEYVQKWMRLELQCWRNCLNQTQEQVETRAYRYWFFIYNLLAEYLKGNDQLDGSLTDMKYAEKRFGEGELLDDKDIAPQSSNTKITIVDIVRILRRFVEASNYGDFHVRLRLLQSFELYLQCKQQKPHQIYNKIDLEGLIAGLRNLQIFFGQFSAEIAETRQTMRIPIEKKLKEFVKIESYNKDLSYFSMRNNVARVHRNLSKFLKEYRQQLEQQITPVFQPQDATVKDYNFENNKGKALRFASKVKYNLQIDVKHFMAATKLQANCKASNLEYTEPALIAQVGKHFLTSRNVVKTTLQNAAYGQMIMALDELVTSQLERCEHLRSLNVDRTKERPKQVLEAKQILQQKRKALTDLFKQLTQLGISYKAGLMEQMLSTDFVDYSLPPFCIRNMICCKDQQTNKEKQAIYANMLHLNENLEQYYAKSVFKLKLLQNIMLKPLSELGPPNIERIKGFAVSLFLYVQNQRQLLAQTTRETYDLKLGLQRLKHAATLITTSGPLNQPNHAAKFENYKKIVCHIRFVLLQFKDLLNCVPQQAVESQQVYNTDVGIITKESLQYQQLKKILEQLLETSKAQVEEMSQRDAEFLSYEHLQHYQNLHKDHLSSLAKMKEICKLPNNQEYLPLANPLAELLNYIEHVETQEITQTVPKNNVDFEKVETELASIVHDILISLQKLYKQHAKAEESEKPATAPEEEQHSSQISKEINEENDAENELQAQHLKILYKSLETDWQELNVLKINKKLEEALKHITTTMDSTEKLIYLKKLATIFPLLEQYNLMAEYQLLQQLGAHKVSAKMLSIMLTVFVEISTKGFCVPPDLMQDEQDGQRKQEQNDGEGFGLEDGTGEKDASDKIESEDQLDDAKRPEDRKNEDKDQDKQDDCKEEKGIEMSEDFDGKMQDIEKPEDEEDDSAESEDEDDMNKEMGETEEGAEKLDEQIWGDDEQPEPEEQEEPEMQEEDEGKGTKDEKDAHNDLDTKNDAAKNKDDTEEHDKNGLDATNEPSEQDKRKQEKQDIDNMNDPEVDEDQANPYHNELEEPPEAEEMDLGDMNQNDDEENGDGENEDNENPFDIDCMKENMPEPKETGETDENENEANEEEDKQNNDSDTDDSDDDNDDGQENLKQDNEPQEEQATEDEAENKEPETQKRGETDENKTAEDEPEKEETQPKEEKPEEHAPSQDKSSTEENVQSMPNTDDKSSADQATKDEEDKNIKQEQTLDEQDTGEEKDGIGQAENEENDGGHQGIAETKETISKEERKNEQTSKEKRKQGRTNEERSLGEAEKNKLKQLKTIEKIKEDKESQEQKEQTNEPESENEQEAEEYQHVKDPKNSDKTTLDNATEEQSKKIQHQEDKENEEDDKNDEADEVDNTHDDLMDVDETENANEEELEEIAAEQNEKKSDKSSKSERTQEPAENQEKVEIEGEIVQTMTVPRGDDTTAHTNKDILLDTSSMANDLSANELLEMRKLYQQQLGMKSELPQHEHYEIWQHISNRMSQNARELCEQLRLILEPTKCTRLKGDYRTGRRINMKKIIPYIASQFRKDKIWLRRTKPAQRDYKITIAIDDSKSMHHNNSKTLTLEAISLVSQALTLLESGRLSVVSFGEAPKIILNHTEQFDGPKLVNALNFSQDKTKIAELLDFIRTVNTEESACGSDNGLFENLLLVLSDGRNIFSEGKDKVKNAVKLARLQRIFLVYIIIDNPENKNSILDVQTMEMLPDSRINIKSYLDDFPFPYYVIVRDLNQLPLVLSEAMRQWFELVNSEQ